MNEVLLFPFAQYWWFYVGFSAFVLLMLLLDLGIFHRNSHAVSIKESILWSTVWISLALIFNVALYFYALYILPMDPRFQNIPDFAVTQAAKQVGLEFLTGFVIEKSLAIDNIFVFAVVFSYFSIPAKYQHRVLFFGILGALIFRAGFIALGASLLQYHWVIYIAGGFLILTGVKILYSPEKIPDPGSNPLIKVVRKVWPITNDVTSPDFFVTKNGIRYATPLFLALVFIEFSDIIFSIDSVPAIFAVTKEPLLVFSSNIFAILGLRSLYFLLAGIVDKFRFLKLGLGLILIFVGLKMTWLNEIYGGKFPAGLSLGIIGLILFGSIMTSILIKPKIKTM